MKQNLIIKIFIFLLTITSFGCKKKQDEQPIDPPVEQIDFSVNLEGRTFKAWDVIPFTFTGNTDILDFYSGEIGFDYAFITGRTLDIKSLKLFFQTRLTGGTQKDQFSVQISSNFNGVYDIASIRAATWKDITSSFILATGAYLDNGEPNIISLITDKTKPFHLAFKYLVKPQTANGVAVKWTVNALSIKSENDLGLETILTQKDGNWKLIEEGAAFDPGTAISTSTGAITFNGNTGAHINIPTETWCIARPLNISSVDLGSDKSILIKGTSDNMPKKFAHIYSEPGKYKVVFTAQNATDSGMKTVTKEFDIIIEP